MDTGFEDTPYNFFDLNDFDRIITEYVQVILKNLKYLRCLCDYEIVGE